jgi:hypothetical protein
MTEKLFEPLFVYEDEDGSLLFFDDAASTDLNLKGVLDDVTLYDAYRTACHIKHAAAHAVLSNLRKPVPPTSVLPTPPTSDEIRALANIYVLEILRSCQKINTAFCTLAGVTEAQIEAAWGLRDPIASIVALLPQEIEALLSKSWISYVGPSYAGNRCYVLTRSGEEQLDTAATARTVESV